TRRSSERRPWRASGVRPAADCQLRLRCEERAPSRGELTGVVVLALDETTTSTGISLKTFPSFPTFPQFAGVRGMWGMRGMFLAGALQHSRCLRPNVARSALR